VNGRQRTKSFSGQREPDGASSRSDRLHAEQIAALFRIAPTGIVGALITWFIFTGVLICTAS
jgi:hypothetical protein